MFIGIVAEIRKDVFTGLYTCERTDVFNVPKEDIHRFGFKVLDCTSSSTRLQADPWKVIAAMKEFYGNDIKIEQNSADTLAKEGSQYCRNLMWTLSSK